jgi:hypothetical protein
VLEGVGRRWVMGGRQGDGFSCGKGAHGMEEVNTRALSMADLMRGRRGGAVMMGLWLSIFVELNAIPLLG